MIRRCENLNDTEALAAQLAPLLHAGDAVLLEGELGAGKTAFARALLRALAADAALEVPSPSYTLVQTYEVGSVAAHHFDLWRLSGPGGLIELGWDEARHDIVVVEWPDRLAELTPPGALRLKFTIIGDAARAVELTGWSPTRLNALS